MAKLRLVWMSIATTVRLRRRLLRHGPSFRSRLHRQLTIALLLQQHLTSNLHLDRAKRMVYSLLHGRAKSRQFQLRMRITINRIINIQRRARRALMAKQALLEAVSEKITGGLQLLRQTILCNPGLLMAHRRTVEMISTILTDDAKRIGEAARLCIELPVFIHTINLVRWFALFRNGGRYNEECYLTAAH